MQVKLLYSELMYLIIKETTLEDKVSKGEYAKASSFCKGIKNVLISVSNLISILEIPPKIVTPQTSLNV